MAARWRGRQTRRTRPTRAASAAPRQQSMRDAGSSFWIPRGTPAGPAHFLLFPVSQQGGLCILRRTRTVSAHRAHSNIPGSKGASMKWNRALLALVLVGATGGAAAPLLAQAVQTATLTGTIKDATGAVLPGVTVTVSSPSQVGGAQVSVTDSQGIYRFPALHPGMYEMDATISGFKTVKRSSVTLPLGTTVTIDVALEVASVSETVQVTSVAPIVDV